jgi:orotate phosphoribosyltransferase
MSVNPEHRERLLELIRREAVHHGDVKLSKGGTSTYYIDCRLLTTHPEGAFLVGEIILDMLGDEEVDAIGGPTLGADPIVGAVCYASFCRNQPLPGFIVRQATKEHGMQKMIEGHLAPGARVVVVEDVLTSGGSVLDAIRKVEDAGGQVVRVIGIVDRLQGARETLEGAGYEFTPIFTREDLGLPPSQGRPSPATAGEGAT